jgi:DNA-directed RNA polymerase subunit M/transcription elongation factor TFIIS
MDIDTTTTDDSLRYVYVPRPRCPVCDSAELKTLRSSTADGCTTRRTKCLDCGHRFFLIIDD